MPKAAITVGAPAIPDASVPISRSRLQPVPVPA